MLSKLKPGLLHIGFFAIIIFSFIVIASVGALAGNNNRQERYLDKANFYAERATSYQEKCQDPKYDKKKQERYCRQAANYLKKAEDYKNRAAKYSKKEKRDEDNNKDVDEDKDEEESSDEGTEIIQETRTKPSRQGPCYPLGDVNNDGQVNGDDAQKILNAAAGKGSLNYKERGDVNGDGDITSIDALLVQQYIEGKIDRFKGCTDLQSTNCPASHKPKLQIEPERVVVKNKVKAIITASQDCAGNIAMLVMDLRSTHIDSCTLRNERNQGVCEIIFTAPSDINPGFGYYNYHAAIDLDNSGTGDVWSETTPLIMLTTNAVNAPADLICKGSWENERFLGDYAYNSITSYNNRLILTTVTPGSNQRVIAREINPSANLDTQWYQVGIQNSQNSHVLVVENGRLNLYVYGNANSANRTVFRGSYDSQQYWREFLDLGIENLGRTGPQTAELDGILYRFNAEYGPQAYLQKCQVDNPNADSDKDGFSDRIENNIGTDPFEACPENRKHDAWPPDFDNNKAVTIGDIFAIARKYKTTEARYDLNQDGIVNLTDIYLVRDLYGKTCR